MKKIFMALSIITAILAFSSCQKKNDANNENYVNPAFKENLSEVYGIISKRYVLDYNDMLLKFGQPATRIIDSVQSEENDALFDSTFVISYPKTTFHYYKRTSDKKFIFTGVDLAGDFKAKQFILKAGSTREEITELFGEPVKTEEKENKIEISYPLYKDEEGKYFDTLIFVFSEDKFIAIRYVPYISNATDETTEEQY